MQQPAQCSASSIYAYAAVDGAQIHAEKLALLGQSAPLASGRGGNWLPSEPYQRLAFARCARGKSNTGSSTVKVTLHVSDGFRPNLLGSMALDPDEFCIDKLGNLPRQCERLARRAATCQLGRRTRA